MSIRLVCGQRVDRYLVEGILGEGGMAVVYRVRHEVLGTPHALKIVSLTSAVLRERLLREGRVQANLRHEHVVQVTDVVLVDGDPGLVMELVEGPPLDAWLERGRPTLDEALAVFRAITCGVAFAHTRGLIHRDLKPGNVLLAFTHDRVVPRITDFGLVKDLDEKGAKTRTGQAMGTPAYMAPEQIRDASSVDWRADLWSLGCILYELTCGVRPFAAEDLFAVIAQVRAGEYVSSRTVAPDLPEPIHRAIEGLLTVDPDARIADAGALLRFLDGDLDACPVGGAAPTLARTDRPTGWPVDGPSADLARRIVAERPLPALTIPSASSAPSAPNLLGVPGPPRAAPSATSMAAGPKGGWVVLAGIAAASFVGTVALVALLTAGVVVAGRSGPPSPAPLPASTPPIVAEPEPMRPVPVAPEPPEPSRPQPAHPRPGPAEPGPPEPAPPAPEPRGAVVTATGADSVSLVGADGAVVADPWDVPPGRYRVFAVFHGLPPVSAGEIQVGAGQRIRLRCEYTFKQCRPES